MFLTDCGNSEEILFLYLIGHFILGNKVMFWHHFTKDLCFIWMCNTTAPQKHITGPHHLCSNC